MKFVIDVNIILDVIFKRDGYRQSTKILNDLILNNNGYISVSSLHTLDYIIRKNDRSKLPLFRELIEKFNICKTPSYIDIKNNFFEHDPEDYLLEVSARSFGARVITSDKEFLKNSDIALHPVDYFVLYNNDDNKINFIDLKRQYQNIYSEVERNIDRVMNHGQYIMGPEIAEFEAKLAKFAGTKYCYTVSDGTKALLIAMMALGIKGGN